MDAISYSYADKAHKRIKKFIENPDSTSGVLTVPKTIAAGETITIPAGRVAILPDLQVDGDLVIDGDLFIPTGSMTSQVVQKVASTDNAIVRFNGTTGEIQNSSILIDDRGNLNITGIGKRITGDFSNSTLNDRVAFQTSILNDSTTVNASPNGTGVMSQFITNASSDASNASRCGINVSANNVAKVFSDRTGTGSFLPLTFYTGSFERMRIDNDGNVSIGTSNSTYGKLNVQGQVGVNCSSGETLSTRGLSFLVDGVKFGNLAVDNYTNLLYVGGALGYGTGAGGTVTQVTSKSTAVTLNKPTGEITMNNASLASGAIVEFALNNSTISPLDLVIPVLNYSTLYTVNTATIGNGICSFVVQNRYSASLSEALKIKFFVVKGANS